jgi:hypothetical protein
MEETKNPEESPPSWEYKKEFGIVGKLRETVLLTQQATEKEIEGLRRKLEKLTYGG